MKKVFTLIAFLTCFLGAKAVEIEDFTVDYTQVGKSTVGWKADLIQDDWITGDEDGLHLYNPEVTPNWYDYQLWIFNGATLDVDETYTIKIVAKVSDGSATVRCRVGNWDGGISGNIEVNSTDYKEYVITGNSTTTSNGLLVQFGDYVGTVSFKSVTITHEGRVQRPKEYLEQLTNGDAEQSWKELGFDEVRFDDMENNFKICAWGKVKGENVSESGSWDPFPATIEEMPEGGHAFVVHAAIADTEGDASAWDNQFWIQSPKGWKNGTEFKLHFRYKASQNATVGTQIHKQKPSDYLHWQAVGDVNFTTEWQDFDQTVTFNELPGDGWSIAFNLNSNIKDATDFYFDDLSWQVLKLDEGLFVASANSNTGIEYDFDNATEFVTDPEDDELMVATVGTAGKEDTWVNEVMISTIRGYDSPFKGATIKPTGALMEWGPYEDASNYKIKLPAAGVWNIYIAPETKEILFEQVEGDEVVVKEPIEINPNPTIVVVNGKERDDLADEYNDDGSLKQIREEEGGTGQGWDNQFFIIANRELQAGEETVVEFKYYSTVEAKTTTQCHGEPGGYKWWNCIGDVNFTTEEQTFSKEFTIPTEADGMKSIAFNMAEIRGACDYTIKEIVWKLKDNTESLIDQTGTKNFYVKEGAGDTPHEFGTPSGISNVVTNNTVSTATYNVAGQRVSEDYKGIVIKNGKKYIVK